MWLHVHLTTDAMTAVFAQDSILTLRIDVLLDLMTDIGQPATDASGGDSAPKRFLADGRERHIIGILRWHHIGECSITMPSIDDGATIDGDDITFTDDTIAWDPMNHFLVDGSTDRRWKSVITLEGRDAAIGSDVLFGYTIEICGRNSWLDRTLDDLKGLADESASLSHQSDLFEALVLDGHLESTSAR